MYPSFHSVLFFPITTQVFDKIDFFSPAKAPEKQQQTERRDFWRKVPGSKLSCGSLSKETSPKC